MDETIHIAFGCDEVFAPHAGVVIDSILHSNSPKDHFLFHVVTTGLSDETRLRLSKIADSSRSTLHFHLFSASSLARFPACHLTPNAYLRMFLPELLPELKRVIYLDCDLLVVNSLRQLWETQMRPGAITAACEDIYSINAKLGNNQLLSFFESLGMTFGETYFNSGVLLIDLDGWRTHEITKKACEWGASNSELIRHADQDILNVILEGHVHYLPLRWNLSIHMILRVNCADTFTIHERDATVDPSIIHFVGCNKPNSLETPMPYQNAYLKRLAHTPWADDFIPVQSTRQKYVRFKRLIKLFFQSKRPMIARILGSCPHLIENAVRVDRFPARN